MNVAYTVYVPGLEVERVYDGIGAVGVGETNPTVFDCEYVNVENAEAVARPDTLTTTPLLFV